MSSKRNRKIGHCLALVIYTGVCAGGQTYKAIAEYKVPGSTANAVVADSDSRRLFIASSGGVVVLNTDTGAQVGQVGPLVNAKDVLLVPEAQEQEKSLPQRAFATDETGDVIEFSLSDLKVIAKVKLPTSGASTLCYDSVGKTVEAVSVNGSLANLDPATGKLIHSGKLPTGSGQIACGTLHHVYVADPAANVVRVLNDETMKHEGDIPVMHGQRPSGLALDTKGRRLFVGCEDGTIDVVDTDAGFTFIELKGGHGPAHELFAWLPQEKGQWKAGAFIAQEDGTLSGVRMNAYINYSLAGTYKLQPGLGAIAYDEKTHHLFITGTAAGAPIVSVVSY